MSKEKKVKNKKLKVIAVLMLIVVVLWIWGERKNTFEAISNGKGYVKIHTTAGGKTYTEYIQGADAPWAQSGYWGGTMQENGCGITSIAIIASAYGKEITPENLREKYYPHLEGDKIPEVLEEMSISNSGFYFSQKDISEERVMKNLQQDKPILICVVNKPNDKWTKKSHYMVLLEGKEDKVYVCNPAAGNKGHLKSGWYKIGEVLPYVVKAVLMKK